MLKDQLKPKLDLQSQLSDTMIFKLKEIIEFCDNYAVAEEKEIEHLSKKEAAMLERQRQEDKVLINARE